MKAVRTAIVHDWLTGMRGGERCLEVFCELFPNAELFTLVHRKDSCSKIIENRKIHTSFLQRIPGVEERYRNFLPLFPAAIEQFDLQDFDLVLSSSHCVAHGAIARPDALHVSYCYTPMRYLYDFYEMYFSAAKIGRAKRLLVDLLTPAVRDWDQAVHHRVSHYIAISTYIRKRIERVYGRESEVVYPPVDCARFAPADKQEDYYLIVSALVPYKNIELAVAAFADWGRRLLIIGSGPELGRLRQMASANIEFLGGMDDAGVATCLSKCRALIFPGEEDFGITPLEAQASGRPVIALGCGGVLETVIGLNNPQGLAPTGVFFEHPTVDSLRDAVKRFERWESCFVPGDCRAQALRFDRAEFKRKIRKVLAEKFKSHYDAALFADESC